MAERFEWDEAKAAINVAKHGVSFDEAMEVFADPYLTIVPTIREADLEARYKAIGRLGDRLLTVVFTERTVVKRMISARRSNIKEEKRYGNRPPHA